MTTSIIKKIIRRFAQLKKAARTRATMNRIQNLKTTPFRGSADWLALSELKMGGLQTRVKRNRVSDFDPRNESQIQTGGMTGGDRMIHHNYAKVYEKYLSDFVNNKDSPVILECGILKGTGLAVWSELFPTAHIIGLDIDLDHTKTNLDFLKSKGAFKNNTLSLLQFDQFSPDTTHLSQLLGCQKLNIIIDDGFHSDETILNTLRALKPYLAESFVYFAEDNLSVSPAIKNQFPEFAVEAFREMTVITPLRKIG